jgi:hypothetical protein
MKNDPEHSGKRLPRTVDLQKCRVANANDFDEIRGFFLGEAGKQVGRWRGCEYYIVFTASPGSLFSGITANHFSASAFVASPL